MKNLLLVEHKGAGYLVITQPFSDKQMSPKQIEEFAKNNQDSEYTLMTVNNHTDNRRAKPDPRVYTLLLTTTFVKQQARRKQREAR